IDEFATLVNPGREIRNTKYHGITTADLDGAPTWAQVASTLLSYLSGAVMVCHNSVFDHAFLSQEFRRVGIDITATPTLCTLVTARSQLDLWGYRLRSVVGRVTGIWPVFEHTALDDARTTARLLRGFLHDAPEPLRLSAPPAPVWTGLPPLGVSTRHRVMADRWDLVHLVEQLPVTRIHRPADAAALDRYRAALHQALDDRKIDVEEARELGELIRCDGLTRTAVEQAHRELLEEHRRDVHADGIVTWQEASALSQIARLVGLPEQVAVEEALGRQDKASRSALAEWRVVGIGLDDDVADVLDLAADYGATTGTNISARTRLVVVNDADRTLPRVRRAEENGKLVLNPTDAQEHLLAAIREATPAQPAHKPAYTREPILRWTQHWRPHELHVEDCIGHFDEDARLRALQRARSTASTQSAAVAIGTAELAPAAAAATRAAQPPDPRPRLVPTIPVVPVPTAVARSTDPPTGYSLAGAQQRQLPSRPQRTWANSTTHGPPPNQPSSVAGELRRKWPWIVAGIVLLLFIIGIISGNDKNSAPTTTTTTPETQAPAGPTRVTVPGDLVGKNAQLVDNELRKLGLVNTIYASQDADPFAPPLENWNVIRVTPAAGTAVFTTDTVLITVTKRHSPVAPVAPAPISKPNPEPASQPPAAPAPPPSASPPSSDSSASTGDSTGGSPYYPNCAAARAAGTAPLERSDPGYRSGL
ncbi:MAG: exonuclease domain-containing protein, partial [Actinomycetota bacterium]|nr:exonuclease domain-containing protein [Actinomycetota bacterium]